MKNILLIIAAIFTFNTVLAQDINQVMDEITIIIKAKNEQELSRYLAPRVEITINDIPKEYTKVQALNTLIKFLNPLQINSYDIVHLSSVDENSKYAITKLVTQNKTYSSSVFIDKIKDKYLIREIHFKDEVSKRN